MNNLYQLKITLKGVDPTVWRVFVVPANITLDRLHDVAQIVMGWEDCHLHSFSFKKQVYMEHPESLDEKDEAFTRLNELLKKKGNKLTYLYDFGDSWEHEIVLEDKNYLSDEMFSDLECIDGMMVCPMEDCGGAFGFMNLLAVIDDPENNEEAFEELLDFIDAPEGVGKEELLVHLLSFDVNEVNAGLALYSRWSRDRELPWIPESV